MKRHLAALFTLLLTLNFAYAEQESFECWKKKKDIVDTAVDAGKFKTLVTAVQAAGLEQTLRSKGPFTVFAPTDDAFAKLPAGTLEYLLQNTDELKDILLYHVAPKKLKAKKVVKKESIATVLGKAINVRVENGEVFLNDSKVVVTNVKAKNGIIHIIDTVLIP